jgi:DNA-binding NarL/FixJ family response regulator
MKILIVDDHAVVRSGLRRLAQSLPDFQVTEAANAAEAMASFKEEAPDLVLLDINLPDASGLELLRRILAQDPGARILIFSMHAEPIYAAQAMHAGARGYVSKMALPAEILDAIGRVAAGGIYIEQQIAQELALSRVPGKGTGAAAVLSERDAELLRLLGQGHSLSEIAEAVGVSYKTVANTISLLKARLGVATTAELVRMAIKTGISP